MISPFKNKKRIVIKIGSSLLIRDGKVRENWLRAFAEDVLRLKKMGKEVVLVSSGAVALGREKLKNKNDKLRIKEKQAAAAIGQIALMSHYQSYFSELGMNVAQILITDDDSADRNRYLNTRGTIDTLLKNDIVPIINENDSIAVEEIKIGDNDRLAARIAQISLSNLLILLSDIDGLYDKNPKNNDDAELITLVEKIDKRIEKMAGGAGSSVGTGGMVTKLKAAKMAFNLGCNCIISNGIDHHPIQRIIVDKKFTLFKADGKKINAKKQWIADCLSANGEVVIDNFAVKALLQDSSLLPVGVVELIGEFQKGDVIFIKDLKGRHIANGIAKYGSFTASSVIGKQRQKELVHRDDLVLLSSHS
ncbi:MAG: glutamate 5-kinase [Rickettsiales bacterium]|jgi:glutamate 5-kinase